MSTMTTKTTATPAANGTKAKATQPKASPAKATVTKHSKCKRCGYAFRAPQVLDHCASKAACDGRVKIRKDEKAAGLDQTAFTAKDVRKQTALARQRLDEHAKAEAATKAS